MVENEKLLAYLKRVSAELYETRERLRKFEMGELEPVAIVGMSCRLPGGVDSPETLWELLAEGTDAIAGLPAGRGWETDIELDPDSTMCRGGFVYDAAEFDAGFFGISPREALAMDPQQRLLLEISWEALERAGIDPKSLRGSPTGVFAGGTSSGYPASAAAGSGMYQMTGTAPSVISGRVSYTLGLEGPAVTVDTACSSSLVALHLAAQALRAGECSLALAGGVTVMAVPAAFSETSRQEGLAEDGRCKAFSADADGTGWAEGAGILVLERLSDARRHGHRVLAVVRGSAVNQDGASNGLTAPNGPSQQRVIRAALASARLSVADVDVVEAHGTGTVLGDPIEAQALLATYGQDRPEDRPLWLGSVKSNIGHAQAAAGVAGIMKMVLALQNGLLPPTLHAAEPSAHVDWSSGQVRLLTEAVPWPVDGRTRRAGVSSFGISGTNAHVILEEAPVSEPDSAHDEAPAEPDTLEEERRDSSPKAAGPVLTGAPVWLVSGRSREALRGQAVRLAARLDAGTDLHPLDVGWALATSRSTFEHRAVVLGGDRDELVAGLSALAAGESSAGVVSAEAGAVSPVVFVFPGQGSQWVGMGRELAETSPVFAARLAECGRALAPYVDWSLDEVLAGASGFDRVDVVQPVLWAVMVSLAAVWQAAGVEPGAVVGHSQGEIAAAVVAGILSLEDAAKIVALRSRALTALSGRGGMLSIAESADEVETRVAAWGGQVAIAAVNGPGATVVSGEPAVLNEIAAECERAGVRTRLLPVDYASHGPQVEGLREEILGLLDGVTPQPGRIPLVSAMTGESLEGSEMNADYWYASLRGSVWFSRAVEALYDGGHRVFVEVSPHPVLTGAIGATLDLRSQVEVEDPPVVVGTLRRDDGGALRVLRSLAEVHVRGVPVDWRAVLTPGRRVDLPTYAFVRERFWAEGASAVPSGGRAEERFWAAVDDGDVAGLAETLALEGRRLEGVLPALASWRRRERDQSRTADWRYRISWVPINDRLSVGDRRAAVLTGTWLVVTGSAGAGSAAVRVEALAGHGADVVFAEVASVDRGVLAARLREVVGGRSLSGVVSLLAMEEMSLAGSPVVSTGLVATVGLIQALGDLELAAPLWVLTSGAVGPEQVPAALAQAQVWGLGRVAALEHPDRWGGLIDVPEVLDGPAADRLCVVLAAGGEDQVAIRGTGVLARRLVRASRSPSEQLRVRNAWAPGGSVLVTGGTGAIGGRLARWVAGRGASRVVLSGRSGPAANGVGALAAELALAGTSVAVLAGDVGVRAEVAALVEWIGATGPRVSSVFHAAGVGGGDPLTQLDAAGLTASMAAKVGGAAHLDGLTVDLDAFVTFSSGAATWGSSHLGGYAAANAFLDALVEDRRGRGLAGTSVAWGLWGGGGMAEGRSGELLQRMGLREMDPELAIGVLAQALDHGEGPVTVADIDWARFAPVLTVQRPSPLIGDLPEARRALSDPTPTSTEEHEITAGTELTARLAGLNRADQIRLLTDLVRTEAAVVLGHSSPEALAVGRAFKDLGFDSLTAVDLRNRLNAATGMTLPATLVFDYPTSAALAGFLRSRLLGDRDDAVIVTATASDEPIAIVGIGCRFPGGVRGPEEFWRLLAAGADVVSDLPADRGWDMTAIQDPASAEPGQAPRGGFLYDAGEFDPGFFGISPREALSMDPQQRLLLETSWEALERAGIDPGLLRGSATGVFVGASWSGYGLDRQQEVGGDKAHLFTGMSSSVLSGRMSYVLGLEGPAVSVDTACSSSLVALHLAGQALRSGECTLALAGGAFVAATPVMFTDFNSQLGLARDGRCKAFGAGADGMGIAEGTGVLVLERLSDARRNGHPVLAVVRGSAVNQDGASNGLMAPNGPSQQRVIRSALASARLSAADVDVVEAHGTGTVLGDPIEAQALLATYGQDRPEGRPLWLGSVKSNIGHTQAAAGMAAVIKMVLALRHQELPRTLHVDEPSPHIDWSSGQVRLLNEPVAWPVSDRPRRAGVSAFGGSGTNVHTILEEAPDPDTSDTTGTAAPDDTAARVLTGGTTAWLLSARSAAGLAAQAQRLGDFTSADESPDPRDVGWSLATTRSAFEYRAVLLGQDRNELTARLAAIAAGEPADGVISGMVPADGDAGRVVFVFPGQGSQWVGMGRELAESSPVFAARLAECGRALAPYVDWSLDDVLAGASGLDRVDVVQPVLWAVMVSLAAVWQAAGVEPDAVVGHSQGEIAAAVVAGILSLEDAAKIVALRSRALTALSGRGGMLSIAESADAVEVRVAPWVDRVSVAAVNGPGATVVSGEVDALAEVLAGCERDGVRARMLPVDYASHGPQVDSLREEILRLLDGVAPQAGRIPMVSAMTGEFLEGPELDAGYWYASLRATVQFSRAVEALGEYGVFIETSAHPVLTAAITDAHDASPVVSGTLRRDDGGPARLLASLAEVHVHGVPVDWAAVLPMGEQVELPTYAFQRQRYWPEAAAGAADVASAGLGSVGHPLLGAVVELADGDALVFTGRLSLTTQPWLADHEMDGTVFFPGSGFAELAMVAGSRLGCTRIDELTMAAPLVLPATDAVQVQVTVGAPDDDGLREIEIFARPVDAGVPWIRHATGRVAPARPPAGFAESEFTVWPPAGAVVVPVDGVHQELAAAAGVGPAFQGLRAAWRRAGEVFAEVVLPEGIAGNAGDFGLHPALLDATLHAVWLAEPAADAGGARMPFAWSGVSLYAVGASVLRARVRQSATGALSLVAADPTGNPVVSVESLVLRPVAAPAAGGALREALFSIEWIPVPVRESAPSGHWAVIGPDGLRLTERLGVTGVAVSAYTDLAALSAEIEAGGTVPEVVLAGVGTAAHGQVVRAGAGAAAHGREDVDEGVAARRVTGEALGLAQRWLALELPARLVVVTQGAVATVPGETVADLGAAAAWGLLRSAQSENPGRLVLADLPAQDDIGAAPDAVGVLVAALDAAEPELAVRGGSGYGRRLARPSVAATPAGTMNDDQAPSPRVPGAVLVTGGTGKLAGLTARHLAAGGRAGQLILVSRSGPAAAGVGALAAGIAAAGAGVLVAACDVGDRAAVTGLLAGLPAGTTLSGVVHTAGVVDDGIIGSLTPDRVDAVMRPKTDAAWTLHELTLGLDLDLFVLFSSAAATFGGPGQGNYAAGNAFLDALAARRRAAGLPAVSLAWGAWMASEGIGRNLSKGLLDRITGSGAAELSADEGLTLLDLALARDEAVLLPVRFDVAGMRAQAARGAEIPALLRGLAGPARLTTASAANQGALADTLRRRLAGVSAAERDRVLTDLVRTHVAAVLGHTSSGAVELSRAFTDLGFDSLTAVDLRNRLSAATGLRLPATLVFDYPTATVLAGHLASELLGVLSPDGPAPITAPIEPGEPIAIVSMSCRFPGDVRDPESLWDLLAAGGDAVTELPLDRGWDIDGLYDPNPDKAGTFYARSGGFVHDAAEFDPGFFGISPREALSMDPQQRLLLEISWEALERAGIDPMSLRGSQTGVFAGGAALGYGLFASTGSEGHLLTGGSTSVLSGRVSYTLGLEGPAVTVDTACSSALVAMHLAASALRAGECSLALAGGVTIMATPGALVGFSRQRGLAQDGRCKAFSASADGIGMAEGAGMILLERLSDARRNGHPVLAVMRGSAVNQDGASNGLTAPNGPSQQRVIRAALANARLSAVDVDVVEAHGTGTTLGDPIEAQALLATYGQDRPEGRPLWLGSVKSNLGHTQSAAGAAGVMKMVLALQHQELPRSLYAEEPAENIDWAAGDIELLAEPKPWPVDGRPRRAGVSSFGISGTNAHVIIEEAPAAVEPPAIESPRLPVLSGSVVAWLVSARSGAGLGAQAGRLGEFVGARPGLGVGDVAWSLIRSRSVFEHRAVVVGGDRRGLLSGLSAVAVGRPVAGVVSGVVPAGGGGGRVVFVFPGQGSQWVGMGRELASSSPVFAARLVECGQALAPYVDWSLDDVLAGASGLDRVDVVQPVLWAVMVSLAAVWQAAGVEPDAVVGHSQGEIAAAVVAGILSLEDAAKIVALRSQALIALSGRGGMLSIAESADAVEARVASLDGRASVAAVNGPDATVVSGDPEALAEVLAGCERDGVRARMLPVDYASHGPQVDALREEILSLLDGVTPQAGRIPMVSAMTGEFLEGPELDAGYWYASLRATVQFSRAVEALGDYEVFIETSAHPVLVTAIGATLENTRTDDSTEPGTERARALRRPPVLTGTLRRDDGGADRLLASLAEVHVHGVPVDWAAVLPTGARVDLPTYVFQRQRLWLAAAKAPQAGSLAEARFWAAVEDGDLAGLTGTLAVGADKPFREVLPALASWRQRERGETVTAGWRYRASWPALPDPQSTPLTGTWLFVATPAQRDLADRCVRALDTAGAEVVRIEIAPGETGRQALADRLDPDPAAERLDADLMAAGRLEPDSAVAGVVSLLALDETPLPDAPGVTAGLAGTLALLQALGDREIEAPLWVLTQGAVAAEPGEPLTAPGQSPVWGLGRVAALEHSGRWGGLIDLPPEPAEQAMDRLVRLLADGGGEDQVAIRGGGIRGRRLVRAPRPSAAERWTPPGTVLVTGGTGAIGGRVGGWLAERGAPRIVLSSRSGPAATGTATLAARLAEAGSAVQVVACDTARRGPAAGLLDTIDRSGPALTAVFHAAGTGQVTPLDDLTVAGLAEVAEAKVAGAVNLDELTAGRELTAFVTFSSGAAVWGSGMQAGYAAANAFLDGLAEHRRGRGLAATSVSWGLWGGGGMGQGEGGDRLQRLGLREMDPDLAIETLAGILDGPAGETGTVTVADLDWARFAPVFTLHRPSALIGDLPEVRQALSPGASGPGGEDDGPGEGALGQQLHGLSRVEQERILTDLVRAEAAAVLGHPSVNEVEADRAFKDLGFDSLTAVELRNRLNRATGMRFPATLVFDYPTPEVLAGHVRTAMNLGGETDSPSIITEIERLQSALSGVTADFDKRDDVTKLLRGMLSNWIDTHSAEKPASTDIEFRSATPDEVFSFLDQELGLPAIDAAD